MSTFCVFFLSKPSLLLCVCPRLSFLLITFLFPPEDLSFGDPVTPSVRLLYNSTYCKGIFWWVGPCILLGELPSHIFLLMQECTVYVENLPPDTTHESLKAKFLEFGPVAYVSIPKFRNSRRIKAGLEKTRVFKKNPSPVVFFVFFCFFIY